MLRTSLRLLPPRPPFQTSGLSRTSPTTSPLKPSFPSNLPHFIPTLPIRFQIIIPPSPPCLTKPESSSPLRPVLPPPMSSAPPVQISSPRARDLAHRQPRLASYVLFRISPKAANSRDSMIIRMPSLDPVRSLQTYWTLRLHVRSMSSTRKLGSDQKEAECTITPCCMHPA